MHHYILPSSASAMAEDEDIEDIDRQAMRAVVDSYMNRTYPTFEPEMVYAPQKEYFLPALKVLFHHKERLFSPGFDSEWKDMELHAQCIPGWAVPNAVEHDAPGEHCNCGIYGSVNLEEIYSYLHLQKKIPRIMSRTIPIIYGVNYDRPPISAYMQSEDVVLEPVLCIVEPCPDAKVILCRKGWRASHVFISEFVENTINLQDASKLLSIAWHRDINLTRLYHEDWKNY